MAQVIDKPLISVPIYGRLGDAFGKRRLFLIGLGILIGGSLILFWAPNLPWLMVGKAVQGLGAASAVPLSMAIIADMFPAEKGEKKYLIPKLSLETRKTKKFDHLSNSALSPARLNRQSSA